jgi:penicillin-binding protein 2
MGKQERSNEIGQKDKYNSAKMEEFQRDHAVHMAFAPAVNRRLHRMVIVENADGALAWLHRSRAGYLRPAVASTPARKDMVVSSKGQASTDGNPG